MIRVKTIFSRTLKEGLKQQYDHEVHKETDSGPWFKSFQSLKPFKSLKASTCLSRLFPSSRPTSRLARLAMSLCLAPCAFSL